MFRNPAVQKATVARMRLTADKMGFDMSDKDLEQYTDAVNGVMAEMDEICDLEEPTLPVLYPRTPGRKPTPEENKYGAWAVKTDIQGEPSGLLAGKTVVVKDSIAVAGVPMLNGSRLFQGYIPEYDATVVTRVLKAGGRIVGKGVCEDCCFSGGSATSASGPVLNPNDTTRMSGGSSSGCGVLVATKEADMAIGADQGGSIRIPSSWCGIVGLKPTCGLVPYTGGFRMDLVLDNVGPMARNVRDCALLLQAIAGYDDGLDPNQLPNMEVPKYSELLTGDVKGLRIGLLKEGFSVATEEVAQPIRQAADTFKELGASVEEVSVPMHPHGRKIFTGIVGTGIYTTMFESYGGAGSSFHGWHSTSLADHLGPAFKSKANELSITMKALGFIGELMKDYNNRFYSKSVNLVRPLRAAYDKLFEEGYDILLMPTLPFMPHKLPDKTVSIKDIIGHAFDMLPNTAQFDMTGHPALTVNGGTSTEGLPIGMMLVGKHFHETTLFNAGHAFEVATGQNK